MYHDQLPCQVRDWYNSPEWDQPIHGMGKSMPPPPSILTAAPLESPKNEAPTSDTPTQEGEVTPTPKKSYAAASGLPDTNAEDDARFAKLSLLRQQIYALVKPLNGAVVGTAEFDNIMTKDAWDKRKEAEKKSAEEWAPYEAAKQKYDADMKLYKAGTLTEEPKLTVKRPEKDKLENLTTCIETQAFLLREGLKKAGLEMKIKQGSSAASYFLGTTGKKEAQALQAWTSADRSNDQGDGPRPQLGDILILSKRGKTVDDVAKDIATAPTNKFHGKGGAVIKAEKELAALQAASEGLEGAKKTASEAGIAQAEAKLAKAKADLDTYLAGKKAQLAKLREDMVTKAKNDQLAFSHVDYLIRIEKNYIDPNEPDVYKEKWLTMDGGQTINNKQGARMTQRVYIPSRNEITGEASQGGDDRWLSGWINVDKLAKGSDQTVST